MSSYTDTLAATMRENQILNARRTEIKHLFSTFQQARQHYIEWPDKAHFERFKPVYDMYQRHQREMDNHKLATSLKAWTSEYFDEQLMILSSWVPKTCNFFVDVQTSGGDSQVALTYCLEFKSELEAVLNKKHDTLAAKITNMVMLQLGTR
jgi:hypothetical protein